MFTNGKDANKSGGIKIEQGENETIIGASVKVDGDFTSEGNVLVQGMVNGSLKTAGNLQVDEGATIKANVEAESAIVRGTIKGNVGVQSSLELGASASVEGDIVTKVLSIEPGAVLHGHCSVSANEKVEGEPIAFKKKEDRKEEPEQQ